MQSKELVKLEGRGEFTQYTVAFSDGREVLLTFREGETPPQVHKASATGVLASENMLSTVNEAESWLMSKVRLR